MWIKSLTPYATNSESCKWWLGDLNWKLLWVLGASGWVRCQPTSFPRTWNQSTSCWSFLWNPTFGHAWMSLRGLGYWSRPITRLVVQEAEVLGHATFSLLNFSSFSLWLALLLTKCMTCLSVIVPHSFFLFFPVTLLHSSLSFSPWSLWHAFLADNNWRDTALYTQQVEITFPQPSSWFYSTSCGVPGGLTKETFHLALNMVWNWKKWTHESQSLGTAFKKRGLQKEPLACSRWLWVTFLFFLFPPHWHLS